MGYRKKRDENPWDEDTESLEPRAVPRIFESIPEGVVADGFWAYYEVDVRNASNNPEEKLVRFMSDVGAFLSATGKMLSVGCGYGLNEIILSFIMQAREIVGIDILDDKRSDAKIRSMKKVASLVNADRVTPLLADGGRLPFREGVFDCVLAIDSLSHADYMREGRDLKESQAVLLVEMSRVLRPGGQLAVVENSAASPRNVMRKSGTSCHPVNPYYLRATLEALGYKGIRVVPYYDLTGRRDLPAQLARVLLRSSDTIGLFIAPFFMLSGRKKSPTRSPRPVVQAQNPEGITWS